MLGRFQKWMAQVLAHTMSLRQSRKLNGAVSKDQSNNQRPLYASLKKTVKFTRIFLEWATTRMLTIMLQSCKRIVTLEELIFEEINEEHRVLPT